jgi:hypothetical protein
MNQVITTRTPFAIYTDRRFQKIASAIWLYHATIDMIVIGVILATYNPIFSTFALNKGELQRLLAALDAGTLGEAWVETVRFDEDYKTHVYPEIAEARLQWERLKDVPTKMGKLGEFWSLSSLSHRADVMIEGEQNRENLRRVHEDWYGQRDLRSVVPRAPRRCGRHHHQRQRSSTGFQRTVSRDSRSG